LRKRAGLTQDQLAESINVSVETVSNMERGIHGPKFDNLEKIANVMGLEVKTLFNFNE
jgi:transcriptional regulator with XRE-family HTH domain